MTEMIPPDTALGRMRTALSALPAETVLLGEGLGRVLADDLDARLTQPPFAASAMDGFAVRSADLADEPVTLVIAGEASAGHAAERGLAPGEAMRISTGAPLPAGADQVVIRENAAIDGDHVRLDAAPRPLHHVREPGLDFARGDRLLAGGTRLDAHALALAAAASHDRLTVTRRARVGLLATGDELVEAGTDPAPGQIVNSIAPGLMARLVQWGAEPRYLGIARDDPDAVAAHLSSLGDLDLLVTVGGASVGDHDHLRTVFRTLGGVTEFEKIALRPGKPTWFGRLGGTAVLGLPGNPVSALVTARLFARVALAALHGERLEEVRIPARLDTALPPNGDRETWLRGVLDPRTGTVRPVAQQDSGFLSGLVAANVLIRRPADAPAIAAGDVVDTLGLD